MAATAQSTITAGGTGSESLRDTVDSIVIAFILAFVFRAFVIEAFIIPTGSMAPTLYGMHREIRCRNCAWSFAFNMRNPTSTSHTTVVCPNCTAENQIAADSTHPLLADSGDRILVLKWPYDIGGAWLGPQRWDVSVFKEPNRDIGNQPTRSEREGKTNFIKRLVGRPGEIFEIIDGDIYAGPAEKVPADIRAMLDPAHRRPLSDIELKALDKVLQIQRKTDIAQKSLWMLHYDHDFPPARREPHSPAWLAEGDGGDSGWDTSAPRVRYDGDGSEFEYITLAGKPIIDNYGYNAVHGSSSEHHFFVGDVRLEFTLAPVEARGSLAMMLSKDNWRFVARIDADGTARLSVYEPAAPDREIALPPARIDPLEAGRARTIVFENVDYRVRLSVDGEVVLQTSDETYGPTPSFLRSWTRSERLRQTRATVRVGSNGMPLELWHLRVLRDVYYQPRGQSSEGPAGTGGQPIILRDGEYYMCGDNSPQSKDSRMWQRAELSLFLRSRGDAYQIGTVPEDQLIGKAFFVYWPAGGRVPLAGWPILPNMGQMRIIR